MPTGHFPGMSYEDMYALIEEAKPDAAKMFSNELLIAIFWEESLFNNIQQIGGTAWGFGQVEPAELYKLETDQAKQNNYYVEELPPREVIARDKDGNPIKMRLCGKLKPAQSVKVSACILCHYYHTVANNVLTALMAYGGVRYKGTDVPKHLPGGGERLHIIHGWLECEAYLKKEWKPNMFGTGVKVPKDGFLPHSYEASYTEFIKAGLRKARRFEVDNKDFDDALFPKNYVDESGQRVWRPQRTPRWLQKAAERGWKA